MRFIRTGPTSIIPKRVRNGREIQYEYRRVETDENACLVDVLNTEGSLGWKMIDKQPKYVRTDYKNVFSGYTILLMRHK